MLVRSMAAHRWYRKYVAKCVECEQLKILLEIKNKRIQAYDLEEQAKELTSD